MKIFSTLFALSLIALPAALAQAGDLKQSYFDATKPGAWSHYEVTTSDGTKSVCTYERKPDENGRVVLAMGVKILAGVGEGAESINIYTMPQDFDLQRNGLSYAKFPEKMVMQFGSMTMPVDEITLESIRKAGKDYRGVVTFEATEKIGERACDRYSYAFPPEGTPPTSEQGQMWLDNTLPFGIVRQVSKVLNADGSVASSFEMQLQDTGAVLLEAAESAPAVEEPTVAPAPSIVSLADGYTAGHVGLDVEAVEGLPGHQLKITLVNKTEAELTVKVPGGDLDLKGDMPVDVLMVTFEQARDVVVPSGESSEPIVVGQRGTYGITEGHCSFVFYEGSPIFTGSVTVDNLK